MSAEKSESLFIGGFPVQTTEAELQAYFKDYQSISSIRIVKDAAGESKSFGFLTLSDPNELQKITRSVHKINGKMVGAFFIAIVFSTRDRFLSFKFNFLYEGRSKLLVSGEKDP